MRQWLALAAWAACPALAQSLPPAMAEALARAAVPVANVAVVVKEAGAAEPALSLNAGQLMNPASVMKLVTTYAGLDLLGPAFTWKTEILAAGNIARGTLDGDLVLKGGGDPRLSVERLWMALKQLRARGLHRIKGDLILDRSYFEHEPHDPALFDNEPLRAYNVGPDALLTQWKAVRFHFSPSLDGREVAIVPDVTPAGLALTNRVRLIDGPCGDWRERVALNVEEARGGRLRVSFSGRFAKSCGEKNWNVALMEHEDFTAGVFAALWKELGGSFAGKVRVAASPAEARTLMVLESPPLAEVIRDINKYSNNVMARQLFLTLSAEATLKPGNTMASGAIVAEWLAARAIPAPGFVIDNGSGLSRAERITAGTLAAMLDAAWRSPSMPEFMASLSVLGVDGTYRRRGRADAMAGNAHLKGGTLNDVRALAGYVRDASGKRWIVVLMINHPAAGQAQAAQEALLQWVHAGARLP